MGVALLGALAMVIAVFLPRVESTSFGGVAENTLIQQGGGWAFIGLAAGIAGATYSAYRRGSKTVAVIVLGALAIAFAIYQGTDEAMLTLVPAQDLPSIGGWISIRPRARKQRRAWGSISRGWEGCSPCWGASRCETGHGVEGAEARNPRRPAPTAPRRCWLRREYASTAGTSSPQPRSGQLQAPRPPALSQGGRPATQSYLDPGRAISAGPRSPARSRRSRMPMRDIPIFPSSKPGLLSVRRQPNRCPR